MAGFSVSPVASINNDTINEIVIGSPGFNNGQGQAYLIPGNPDLSGIFSLTDTENQPGPRAHHQLDFPDGEPELFRLFGFGWNWREWLGPHFR